MEKVSEMTSGMKFDGGKDRWDLLPWKAAREIVSVLTYGCAKYKAWNWLEVTDANDRYFAAALRHLTAWRGGETIDPESGQRHLAHAACCVIFLLGFEVGEKGPEKKIDIEL